MELSINTSTQTKGDRYTLRDTPIESSSLTSLSKPSLSSGKVLSSQFQDQKLSSLAPSSQTLLIPLLINTYLSSVESSNYFTIYFHSLLILLTNDSPYSLHILYPRACPSTIMILLHQLKSLSLPSSHTKFFLVFVIMEPIIFIYSFTIEGCDVTVTIEFFLILLCQKTLLQSQWMMSLKMWILSLICEIANS